jgi:hypothetical protein
MYYKTPFDYTCDTRCRECAAPLWTVRDGEKAIQRQMCDSCAWAIISEQRSDIRSYNASKGR